VEGSDGGRRLAGSGEVELHIKLHERLLALRLLAFLDHDAQLARMLAIEGHGDGLGQWSGLRAGDDYPDPRH